MTAYTEKCAELRRSIAEDLDAARTTTKQRARKWGVSEPTVKLADAEKILRDNRDAQSRRSASPDPEKSRDLVEVDFHGVTLIGIPGETPETTLIAMKPFVEGMKIDWGGQRKRLERDPVLSTCTYVLDVQLPGDTQSRSHTFLALHRVHYFLTGISLAAISDENVRRQVLLFQNEAADVLAVHFLGKVIGSPQPGGGIDLVALNDALEAHYQRVTESRAKDLVPIKDQLTRITTVNVVQAKEIRELWKFVEELPSSLPEIIQDAVRVMLTPIAQSVLSSLQENAHKVVFTETVRHALGGIARDNSLTRLEEKFSPLFEKELKPETAKILEFQERAEPILRKIVDNTTRADASDEPEKTTAEEPRKPTPKPKRTIVEHADPRYVTSEEAIFIGGWTKGLAFRGFSTRAMNLVRDYCINVMEQEWVIFEDDLNGATKYQRAALLRWLDAGGRETIQGWIEEALKKKGE